MNKQDILDELSWTLRLAQEHGFHFECQITFDLDEPCEESYAYMHTSQQLKPVYGEV